MRRIHRSALSLLVLSCFSLASADLSAQVTRAFPETPELLAVRTTAPHLVPDLAELSARAGLEITGARPYGAPDFRLLELAAPADGEARRLAVNELARHRDVLFATRVRRCEYGLPMLPTQRILIRFLPEVGDEVQRELLSSRPGLAIEEERFGAMDDAWSLTSAAVTGEAVLDQVDALSALPGVRWVESDRAFGTVSHDVIPDDPMFGTSWGLHNTGQVVSDITGQLDFDMDLPEAWDLEQGDDAVIVVVMDNGTQLDHPDLNYGPGADFTGNGSNGGPHNACSNHGTAVAGCVSAIMNNALGVAGAAPGCRIAPAAVGVAVTASTCPGTNSTQASWKVNAFAWAEQIGARVTNQSYSSTFDQAWSDKMEESRDNGILHFASSGNAGVPVIGFPASDPAVLAIGAVQNDGQLADYSSPSCTICGSNTGPEQQFVAPGRAIDTTDRTGADGYGADDYASVGGTSFASPYAAAVAALLFSRHPSMTPFQVELVMEMSARDMGAPGRDDTFGYGLIQADYALRLSDQILPELQSGVAFVDGGLFFQFPPFFDTVADGTSWVGAGGAVILEGGSYDEALVIDKDVTLYRRDSRAVVGE